MSTRVLERQRERESELSDLNPGKPLTASGMNYIVQGIVYYNWCMGLTRFGLCSGLHNN